MMGGDQSRGAAAASVSSAPAFMPLWRTSSSSSSGAHQEQAVEQVFDDPPMQRRRSSFTERLVERWRSVSIRLKELDREGDVISDEINGAQPASPGPYAREIKSDFKGPQAMKRLKSLWHSERVDNLDEIPLSGDIQSNPSSAICPELVVSEGAIVWPATLLFPRPRRNLKEFAFLNSTSGECVCSISSHEFKTTIAGLNGVPIIRIVNTGKGHFRIFKGDSGKRIAYALVRRSFAGNTRIVLRSYGSDVDGSVNAGNDEDNEGDNDTNTSHKPPVIAILVARGDQQWAVFTPGHKCAAKATACQDGFGVNMVLAGGVDSLIVLSLALIFKDYYLKLYLSG